MKEQRLEELFDRYINRATTDKEEDELMSLLIDPELSDKKEKLLEVAYDSMPSIYMMSDHQAESVFNTILEQSNNSVKRKQFLLRTRWWAAACIILALGVGAYSILFNKKGPQSQIVKTEAPDVKPPATNRAMITLANGQHVHLDSIGNGQIAQQGNIKLVKLTNGQIAYETATGEIFGEIQYNTLYNPAGSKVIDMMLSDGSHVWLNANSSVTYPIAFIGNERKVTVNGEAYFEIAHNAAKPFKVSKGEMTVEVLGTHFNVNAYDDDSNIKVTLLEGTVRVSIVNREWSILKPGQQAIAATHSPLTIHHSPDLEAVMAWKNGYFHFGNTSLQDLMKQLSRWYDIEVVYQEKAPAREFGGEISRQANLSQVLKILEESKVRCRIEGRKLIVE